MGAELNWLTVALLAAGCFFVLTGAVGVLRFPDFHARIHPAAKGDTLGQMLILGGLSLHLALQAGLQLASLKLLLIVVFLFLTAPTATHAMAHSAWVAGVKPEDVPEEPDEITAESAS
jgi:multicomponent Na+:H+ antiporter subunit G